MYKYVNTLVVQQIRIVITYHLFHRYPVSPMIPQEMVYAIKKKDVQERDFACKAERLTAAV